MTDKTYTTPGSEFGSEFDAGSRNHFDATISRLLDALGAKDIGELAGSLGISRQAINKARSANKIPPAWFIHIGFVAKVSIDWLVTGEGPMRKGENGPVQQGAVPTEPPPRPPEEEWKMSDMLTKTAEVLESDTIYRTALASNINAFHQAVRSERTLARIEERMAALEQSVEELRRENQELRQRQNEQPSQSSAVGE